MNFGLIVEIVLGAYALISSIVSAYLGYKYKKESDETEAEIAKKESAQEAKVKMNKQSQEMLKFWVGEFKSLKENWREREKKLRRDVEKRDNRIDELEDKIEEKEDEILKLEKKLDKRNGQIDELQSKVEQLSKKVNGDGH